MNKLNYMADVAFDISPFEPGPCKVYTDEEISSLYPGIPVTRRVMTQQEKFERIQRNLRAMNAASKKTKKSKFED